MTFLERRGPQVPVAVARVESGSGKLHRTASKLRPMRQGPSPARRTRIRKDRLRSKHSRRTRWRGSPGNTTGSALPNWSSLPRTRHSGRTTKEKEFWGQSAVRR